MGRPRKAAPAAGFVVTPTPAALDVAPGDAPDEQTTDQLAAGADEGQKAPRARVTRWNENMRVYATLDHVPATNLDESWIRDEYGGGKYLVYFWGTRKDGTYGYLTKQGKEFIIDDSIPFKGALRGRPLSGPVRDAPKGEGRGTVGDIMDMGIMQLFKGMQDNSAAQAQMARDHSAAMMAMLERIAAPRESGIAALLPLLTPLLSPLLAGLLNRKDPIEAAREIAALMKGDTNTAGTLRDMIGAFRELGEVREMLGPLGGAQPPDEEGRWFGLIEKLVPGAMQLLQQESARTGQPVTAIARALPAGSPATPAGVPAVPVRPVTLPPAPMTPTAAVDEWTPLEPYVSQLVAMAAQNKSAFGVAQTIVTIAPPAMIAAIRELVARDDAVQTLVNRFPTLGQYPAWLAGLVGELYAELLPEDEDDAVPAGVESDATLPEPPAV